jgi:hypothetical protein
LVPNKSGEGEQQEEPLHCSGESTQTAPDSQQNSPLIVSSDGSFSDVNFNEPPTKKTALPPFVKAKTAAAKGRVDMLSGDGEDSGHEDIDSDLPIDRLNLSLWEVRHRQPTTTKKGEFVIPYTHCYQDGKFGTKTVVYYVCREQLEKGKLYKTKPFLIRPSFISRRRRTVRKKNKTAGQQKLTNPPSQQEIITTTPQKDATPRKDTTPHTEASQGEDATPQDTREEEGILNRPDISVEDLLNRSILHEAAPSNPPPAKENTPHPEGETVVTVETAGHTIKVIITPNVKK